jgi:hypothetical protein
MSRALVEEAGEIEEMKDLTMRLGSNHHDMVRQAHVTMTIVSPRMELTSTGDTRKKNTHQRIDKHHEITKTSRNHYDVQ